MEQDSSDGAMTDRPRSSREWQLIESMLNASVVEQRRSRRWGIFFKSLMFLYLFLVLAMFAASMGKQPAAASGPHTALIELRGIIEAEGEANADRIITALREAFEASDAKGVILRINSPGGSPVQSGYIYDEMIRLRALHPEKPLYAVVTDIGASGGYYIAAAADQIYADKASLVGSIGVTGSSFGFVEALEKLGVERRAYTSGTHKAFLDPFQPEDPDQVALWEEVLATTHRQFIAQVEAGRGERLQKDNPLLYSGMIWTGEQALELGLVDALGSSSKIAREILGAEEIVDYTLYDSPLEQLVAELGASAGHGIASSVMKWFPQRM